MKYAIIVISILLIAGILLSGCAANQQANTNPQTGGNLAAGSNVSQQQLDDLKNGVESMNPEDLGGLSE